MASKTFPGGSSKPSTAPLKSRKSPAGDKTPFSTGDRSLRSAPAKTKPKQISGFSKPSDRLNPKTIDPFNDKSQKTSFQTVYSNGGIPCRLVHGSVKHKLQWDTSPQTLPFDPIIITLAEGLKEKKHPYTFVAQQGFHEMLEVEDAECKVFPILPKLVPVLRSALASSDGEIFLASLQGLVHLSNVVGPALNSYLKVLLPQISRQLTGRRYKDEVLQALQQFEVNGGKESVPLIKSKVPTYQSVCL